MTSQTKSVKLWDWFAIQKEQDDKSSLAKNFKIIEERSDDMMSQKLNL